MFRTHDLGRAFGVSIRLHGSTLLLVGLLALVTLLGQGLGAAASTVGFVAAVLGCVTLHELGHIGVARLFGNHTRGITLYPFGGVAELTRPSRSALEETLVALAGPAVNVALAAVAALPLFTVGPALGWLAEPLSTFLWVNVGLALFNLVPAYPMDGGRVLRGLLWSRVGAVRATRWAARAGQGLALVGGALGVLYSPMLVVIAVFIFMQASAELRRLPADDDERAPWSTSGAGPVQRARPFTWPPAADPFAPRRAVRVHTPSGSFEEIVLADGRRVRRYL